jgi:NifU-like protein involved in Fe-S cluster formation
MEYSEKLMELFMNPKNVGTLDVSKARSRTGVRRAAGEQMSSLFEHYEGVL